MDNTINFLSNCRVCDNPDEYANLFYSINRELLCNLISLLGENVRIELITIKNIGSFMILGNGD